MAQRNMIPVSMTQLTSFMSTNMQVGIYKPITILGKTGIGKTEGIEGLAKEKGWKFKTLRLLDYDVTDLVGLPYVKDGKTYHAASDLLPDQNETSPMIFMLDEVTSCDKSLRTAVYQLLDGQRALGVNYKLPEKCLVVACGNDEGDGGDFKGIESAFFSRGFAFRLEPDFDSWKSWAVKNSVNPSVVAYLTMKPNDLFDFGPEETEDSGNVTANPRSWVSLSTYLSKIEELHGGYIKDNWLVECAAGSTVGYNKAGAFSAFYGYNFSANTIDVNDIIDGKITDVKVMDHLKTEQIYLIAEGITSKLIKIIDSDAGKAAGNGFSKAVITKVANVVNWFVLIDNVKSAGVDVAITVMKQVASASSDLTEIIISDEFSDACPKFEEWIQKHDELLSILSN